MAHTPRLPTRARSLESSLWQTRALAGLALLVLFGAVVSYTLEGSFWVRHAPADKLVGGVMVVMLSSRSSTMSSNVAGAAYGVFSPST
jgi:hypothetical protein